MMQSSHSDHSQTAANNMTSNSSNPPDTKVLQDLSTLSEQIKLCQSMLVNGGDIDANEALLTVIGFLEACVPRMVELIEAAAQGALKPETFEECLVVNDKLTNVLADVDKDPKDRQPLTPAAAAPSAAATASNNSDDVSATDDIDQGMHNLSVAGGGGGSENAMVGGGKTTGLDSEDIKPPTAAAAVDDPFAGGPDLLAPSPPENAFKISESMGSTGSVEGEATAAKTNPNDNDDDFDAFFRDRTAAP